MRKKYSGSMTIFLALCASGFLCLCMVLVEGVRTYYYRVVAEQAMDLAEFSVLSEYQQELFENYGLFFLDLDYEQGEEKIGILQNHAQKYLRENAAELQTQETKIEKIYRATDGKGAAFFEQAVEVMKVQSGYKLFEELLDDVLDSEEEINLAEMMEQNEAEAKELLEKYKQSEGAVLDLSIPNCSFPSVKALTKSVFGELDILSEKTINLEERLLRRSLEQGSGCEEKITFTDMQLFYAYLFKYFSYYGTPHAGVLRENLEYQLEYIVSGKDSDRENIENVMWRIFLLRAGSNIMFYLQNPVKKSAAETKAILLVGITGSETLIKIVTELLLISEAIETSVEETKEIFAGEKVPLYQNGILSEIELGYEEYLYLLLNVTGKMEKIYRCMDVVEMEVRTKSGYAGLSLDHCTDCFEFTWTYQFESLFVSVPLLDSAGYQNVITRRFFYER